MSDEPVDDDEQQLQALIAASESLEDFVERLGPEMARLTQDGEVNAGLRFVHLVLTHVRDQLSTVTASHEAVLSALLESGHIDEERYTHHRHLTVVQEQRRRSALPDLQLADIDDKYALEDLPEIDCLERLHLCRARCCTFDVPLSEQDLDEGVAKWQYGRPYLLRKGEDGRCVHNADGRCTIFGARPGACRVYDCRRDRRIWLDFDNRIPAPN